MIKFGQMGAGCTWGIVVIVPGMSGVESGGSNSDRAGVGCSAGDSITFRRTIFQALEELRVRRVCKHGERMPPPPGIQHRRRGQLWVRGEHKGVLALRRRENKTCSKT